MNNIYALAGLLTYSPWPGLPVRISETVAIEWALVLELTAAGQSGIYTRFPFNHPDFNVATNQKRCKGMFWALEMQVL